jgi:hypothetical protein
MATVGQTLRLVGLKANRAANGDLITFRARHVRALVEPVPLPEPGTMPHAVKFGERGEVSIEIIRTDVDSAPTPGEYIIDAEARRMRVVTVARTPLTYVCECKLP